MSNKAILVQLQVAGDSSTSVMIASCMGERSIQRSIHNLPSKQPAHALAKLMCHQNNWTVDLVYGLLPNGDEVFCFRNNRG
jgi:hypothetical protein